MSLTENNDVDGLWVEIVSKASTYTKKDFFFLGEMWGFVPKQNWEDTSE